MVIFPRFYVVVAVSVLDLVGVQNTPDFEHQFRDTYWLDQELKGVSKSVRRFFHERNFREIDLLLGVQQGRLFSTNSSRNSGDYCSVFFHRPFLYGFRENARMKMARNGPILDDRMNFAVPLAASLPNVETVETVETASAVGSGTVDEDSDETPDVPTVPQIPRGRRLHADTVFFAPSVAVDSRGTLSPLVFTLPYEWMLDDRKNRGNRDCSSRDVFRQRRRRDGNGRFFRHGDGVTVFDEGWKPNLYWRGRFHETSHPVGLPREFELVVGIHPNRGKSADREERPICPNKAIDRVGSDPID